MSGGGGGGVLESSGCVYFVHLIHLAPSLTLNSIRHLHVLQLPVCVLPPRREERLENVSSQLRGGAPDFSSGCRLRGGIHGKEARLGDLLLFYLLPLAR